jgi:hypothetical protein
MRFILLLLAAMAVQAQNDVIISQKSPSAGYQFIMGYSGDNLLYLCKAASTQPVSPSIAIASATNASPVVMTVSGGHGFDVSALPIVTISGGTGSWVAVNGSFTATVINSTTFSIVVDSTAFGAVSGTLTFTTRAPRTTSNIWSVQKFVYSGSNMIWSGWVGGTPSFVTTCTSGPSQYQ